MKKFTTFPNGLSIGGPRSGAEITILKNGNIKLATYTLYSDDNDVTKFFKPTPNFNANTDFGKKWNGGCRFYDCNDNNDNANYIDKMLFADMDGDITPYRTIIK